METINKYLKQNHLYSLVLASLLVIGLATASFWQLRENYLEQTEDLLQAKAGTVYQHYTAWNKLQRAAVYNWSSQPELIRMNEALLAPSSSTSAKLTDFALNDYLRPLTSQSEFLHYYLLGPDQKVLSSSNPDPKNLLAVLPALERYLKQGWLGFSVVSTPLVNASDSSVLYSLAPVRNVTGQAISLLILEIDPNSSFYSLFDKSAFGETGEAYLFDMSGYIISASRALGSGHLHYPLKIEAERQDDTRLKSTISFKQVDLSGYQVREPYLSYQNQPVVGGWVWDKNLGVGVAVEQSAEESNRLLDYFQKVFILFSGAVVISITAFFGVLINNNIGRVKKERAMRQTLSQQLEQLHREKTHEIESREARYRSIIDTAWDAIFAIDNDNIIRSLNPAVGRIFGGSASNYLGLPLGQIIENFTTDNCPDEGRLVLSRGMSFESLARRSDGSLFPVTVSISSLSHHEAFAHTVIVKDISKQKEAENAIKTIQERLELSQSFASIGTWEWHVAQDQVICTSMALKLMGVAKGSLTLSMSAFTAHIPAEELEGFYVDIQKSIRENRPFYYECRVTSPLVDDNHHVASADSYEWVLIQGTPIQQEQKVATVIGHIQRISARKKSEVELNDARNMLKMVLDTIPSGVYWKDSSFKYAGINSRFAKDIGLPVDEILGRYDQDIYKDTKQSKLIANVDRSVMLSGKSRLNESLSYQMNNGEVRQIEISRLPIIDEKQCAIGVLGVYSDITERVEAQRSLHQHHRLLASIYTTQLRYFSQANKMEVFSTLLQELLSLTESEYGFIGKVCYTPENQVYLKTFAITDISWNEETRRLYQSKAKEGLEFHNLETLFGHTLKTAELVLSNDPANDPRSGGIPAGHPGLNSYLGIPIMVRDQMLGMVGIANRAQGYNQELVDFLRPMLTTCANLITAMNNADAIAETQVQLLQAKTSAENASRAKTEFLSRMSHELRTPMNAILGFTNLLKEFHPEEGEPKAFLEEIDKAGNHLMVLINEVLDLERIESGRIELTVAPVNIADLVESCIATVEPMAEQLGVQLILEPSLLSNYSVRGDAVRVKQILLNLLSNAIKYNKPKGTVRVELALRLNQFLEVAVSDTGRGIAEEEQAHLFESFNRLHAEGSDIEGTGMGLVISRRLAEMMQGSLNYRSALGEGSCFWVQLPLCNGGDNSLEIAPTTLDLKEIVQGGQNILYGTAAADIELCCPKLGRSLAMHKDRVEHADSAMQFLEYALQHDYSLMIFDEAMNDIALEDIIAYLDEAGRLLSSRLLVVLHSGLLLNQLPEGVIVHLAGEELDDYIEGLL